ncbi:BA14K family protein [Cohaesibacter sp. CAU 1516]|uniref:BA14K family protein n=1 Tax=Cohaesibacter sp. CAU 1516 TaxID=2576038 RepID=UPI0010FD5251|nr:BA14K family protein [Cohaesibacter sp. CAU 1516]TLP48623.1 BA14K family protein [Cohaesibacter sp. CAU 1516]
MFKKAITTFALVATLATAATFAAPTTEAEARGRGGALVAGAITGLAVGTIAHARHRHHGHRYYGHRYYGPRYRPHRARYYGRPAPWTRAWYRYCSSKYRSFNPRTGYFTSYGGRKRFCR